MKRVLICNARSQESVDGEIITSEAFDVTDFLVPDAAGDTVYIIDVHFSFMYGEQENKRQLKFQEQGGVTVYRHLLGLFKGCPDKLKVVFYSPLTANRLTALRPENYVLNLLPFVELFPKDEHGNLIESWTFEGALQSRIDENDFPQFNNASENLLSGWALSGANKIDLKGKRLLIIDDEWQQWKVAFRAILDGSVDYFLKDKAHIKLEFKKLSEHSFSHLPRGGLAQYDVIISDLYLWETHETGRWKTEEFINSISGFLLFKLVRNIEPAIPVIFHTTSTKFRIYEALSALGSDGQVPKNLNSEPRVEDKVDTYQLFRQSVVTSTDSYSGCWLNEFYRFISDDKSTSDTWWQKRLINDPAATKEVKDLVKHAILGYKKLKANYQDQYLKAFFSGNEIDPIAMSASGILNNVGKIKEVLRDEKNPELQFIDNLRDLGSHSTNYHLYGLDDVKVVLVLLFQTMTGDTKRVIAAGENYVVPFQSRKHKHKFKHQLLYYVHYYNYWQSFIPRELRATFKTRITYYTEAYYSERWQHFNSTDKNTVKNSFKSIRIDPSISSAYKEEVVGDKLIIAFRE
jgi:hypothetical protein